MDINDKKLKQILEEQSKDFKRHVSTLTEDFHSQVKLIGEQYSPIKETLDFPYRDDWIHERRWWDSKNRHRIYKNSLKRKVDVEDFAVLEKRVATLESKVRAK